MWQKEGLYGKAHGDNVLDEKRAVEILRVYGNVNFAKFRLVEDGYEPCVNVDTGLKQLKVFMSMLTEKTFVEYLLKTDNFSGCPNPRKSALDLIREYRKIKASENKEFWKRDYVDKALRYEN